MKKRMVIVLVCLTLVCSFAACDMELGGLVGELFDQGVGDYVPSDDNFFPQTAVEETWIEDTWIEIETTVDDGEYSDLPTNLYAGQRLVLLGSTTHDLGFDDRQEDAVDVMSYGRNKTVEQTYGITVEPLLVDADELGDLVRSDDMSGQGTYDLVMGIIADPGASLAQTGMLLNLYDLPYLDIKNSHWDADNHSGLAIGSFLPMATGDVVPTSALYTSVLLFNAEIAEEMGVNLYDYVQCGGWTVPKMHSMVQNAYTDLNGDAMTDPDEDLLGFITTHEYANSFAVSTDVMLIDKAEANYPLIATDFGESDLARILTAYEHVSSLLRDRGTVYGTAVKGINAADAQNVFARGNALFYGTNINQALTVQQYSEIPFGLLPYPKLDESQESYQSWVDCSSTAVMVPAGAKDLSFVGYALEAMARASSGMFESSVGMRFCRSGEDAEMLRLVLDSKTLDFGSNYFYVDLGYAVQYLTSAMDAQNPDLSSLLSKNEKSIRKALDKLLNTYYDR